MLYFKKSPRNLLVLLILLLTLTTKLNSPKNNTETTAAIVYSSGAHQAIPAEPVNFYYPLPSLDNLMGPNIILLTDPLLPHLWHLQNNGYVYDVPSFRLKQGADAKVIPAWHRLGNLGDPNIIIAVIDNGFDIYHPDLRGKIVAPLHISSGSPNLPRGPSHGDHGTACATVALGAANEFGAVGAAPMARLMPLHGLTFSTFLTKRMFDHCVDNKADIISCSWGTIDARYEPGLEHFQAIENAAINGRDGKGCVIVFAAGNEGQEEINYYGRSEYVIVVGASTSSDTHANYSNRGYGISVVAPSDGGWPIYSGRASWDPGADCADPAKQYYVDGRNRGEESKHFGGTSSATSLVSGICALILSANPDLTASQVKFILEDTADKIGNSLEYDDNGYSIRYGYGKVNADRAVQLAISMRSKSVVQPRSYDRTVSSIDSLPSPTLKDSSVASRVAYKAIPREVKVTDPDGGRYWMVYRGNAELDGLRIRGYRIHKTRALRNPTQIRPLERIAAMVILGALEEAGKTWRSIQQSPGG
jgi:subtilisin family serine protease